MSTGLSHVPLAPYTRSIAFWGVAMTTHVGWPPGMVLRASNGVYFIDTVDGWAPVAGAQGAPGDTWVFDQATANQHAEGYWPLQALKWLARVTFIDGSGSWTVPPDWYDLSGVFVPTYRVTLIGRLQGEIWNASHCVVSASTAQQIADAVAAHKGTLQSYFQSYCNSGVWWDSIRVTGFDPATGVGTGDVGEASAAINGQDAASSLPTEVALVVTQRTTHAKVHGRMYLPAPTTTSLTTDGRVTSSKTSDVVGYVAAYFHALMADTVAATPVVYSTTGRLTRNVTRVDVGNVFDSQRRRRNRLVEARTSITI